MAFGFTLAMDPYGVAASPTRAPTPIMDTDQRRSYPQLVRGGHFDSAVFGNSSVRLLDPGRLDPLFGGRFVNLAFNSSTPWEQTRMAELFLYHVPIPRTLVFGLDPLWCGADADQPARRLTPYGFPDWLYETDRRSLVESYGRLFSLHDLEVAFRVAAVRLHLAKPRIRRDGYAVFMPPEASYDLERARQHIWGGGVRAVAPVEPPVVLDDAARERLTFPALDWLAGLLDRVPEATLTILVFPPIHIAAQPVPGSQAAALDAACKARIAAIGLRHRAVVIDFRHPSPLTSLDENYWDQLHVRLGIADRVTNAIHRACLGAPDQDDTFFDLLSSAPDAASAEFRSCGGGGASP